MKLYYANGTISIAVAIALHEAGLAFDTHRLDFAAGEQRGDAYAAINPKGRVPALDIDGTILTETGAILDYIAAQTAGLMPTDPMQAAKARAVMYYLASTVHVNHAHKGRGSRWADTEAALAEMTAKVPQTMTASAAYIDAECLTGPYVMGADFCVADAYLFLLCTWMPGDKVDLTAFPKIRAFMEAMNARPSVEAVRAAGMLG